MGEGIERMMEGSSLKKVEMLDWLVCLGGRGKEAGEASAGMALMRGRDWSNFAVCDGAE
jgi:hypothetical protein